MYQEEIKKRLGEKVILSDAELLEMLGELDSTDMRLIRGQTLLAQFSLREARNTAGVAAAVREFDEGSKELGERMEALTRAMLFLAFVGAVLAAAVVPSSVWDQLYSVLKFWFGW